MVLILISSHIKSKDVWALFPHSFDLLVPVSLVADINVLSLKHGFLEPYHLVLSLLLLHVASPLPLFLLQTLLLLRCEVDVSELKGALVRPKPTIGGRQILVATCC